MDALISQFNAAATIDEAKKIFKEADMYALQQCWAVNVCPVATPFAWQPWIKGYSGELQMGGALPAIYRARIWIDQDLKKSMGH